MYFYIYGSEIENYKNINKKLDQVHNSQLRIVEKFDRYDDNLDLISQLETIESYFVKIDDYLINLNKINNTYVKLEEKIKTIENMKNIMDTMRKRIIDLENKNKDSFEIKLDESKKYNFII